MRRSCLLVAASVLCGIPAGSAVGAPLRGATPLHYPPSPRGEQLDSYHGVSVADPYRWLEDVDSEQTRAWVEAQGRLTSEYLAKIPERDAIRERVTRLVNRERYDVPVKEGGRYFYLMNTGLQNQDVLYVTDSLAGKARVLLDPNALSPDGTVSIDAWEPSPDGRDLAYALATAGSDWAEWHVRDVTTGEDLMDHLKWAKFSGAAWTHDSKGFFYERFPEPRAGEELSGVTQNQKLYYHRLGDKQADDILIYERPDHPEWYVWATLTDDGRYLIISTSEGTDPTTFLFLKDLGDPLSPAVGPESSRVTELLVAGDAQYTLVGNDGPVFWVLTDKDAPLRRVVAVDSRDPAPERWREIIPEGKEALDQCSAIGGRLVAGYMKDACSVVRVFSTDGTFEREVPLPGLGTTYGFGGKQSDPETFYSFTSFALPGPVCRYDLSTGETSIFREPRLTYDPADYETRQVFYQSKDGTRVPMFVVHKKGLELDGRNPAFLYGYGGFGASSTPSYNSGDMTWLQMGGVYALACIRGGGEYGEAWHEAAEKTRRQTGFDDFIAAAEWLIDNDYTSHRRLAIGGDSNGGLLVGACITQRPRLFGAALIGVGVLDMLRFPQAPVGWGWIPEYGSPEDPEEFAALYAYSPLHRLREGMRYPATMLLTADHDDRVPPWHSYKFTAALQTVQAGSAPILLRVETDAGHGQGLGTTKLIDEYTDRLAFLASVLGMEGR